MRYGKFWAALGSAIRGRRRKAGRTHKGMAMDLDIPRPSYTLIESGGRTIDAAELVRICSILGLSVQGLLWEALKVDHAPEHPWLFIRQQETKGDDE